MSAEGETENITSTIDSVGNNVYDLVHLKHIEALRMIKLLSSPRCNKANKSVIEISHRHSQVYRFLEKTKGPSVTLNRSTCVSVHVCVGTLNLALMQFVSHIFCCCVSSSEALTNLKTRLRCLSKLLFEFQRLYISHHTVLLNNSHQSFVQSDSQFS